MKFKFIYLSSCLTQQVKVLKGKEPGDIYRACEELAAVYLAAGKVCSEGMSAKTVKKGLAHDILLSQDYGVGGNSWLGLLRRNRELYEICMDKLRRGDKSLGDLVEEESSK